ncbi:MAG: hypothetical protein Q8Q11_02760 [bacterium]|nr:hypothetical protein [bacterium]MDZ4247878.1 hypothetical protein [Patescibacteria group bacterium]
MPQVNVVERKHVPKLDRGLLAGLVAGAVVWAWALLIGALGSGAAADYGSFVSASVLGPDALDSPGFGLDWLVGSAVHFVVWALIGIVWALLWPKLRKYGVLSTSLLFALAAYVVVVQIIGRLIDPEMVSALGVTGLLFGYLFGGLAFAFRYRTE